MSATRTSSGSFGDVGAVFEVTGSDVLGVVAMGAIPFSLGWMVMERLHRDRLNWQAREPE
ncbi:hypothetical protein [Micromonospora sp. NPDC005413]|uniref:hypothetical protein n=1 Tax=Micromonospora sp. NPDC005413 TaxID=3154563 RepID=UPI0033BA8301